MRQRAHSVFVYLIAFLLAGAVTPTLAQQTATNSYQAMSDKFFDLLQQGKAADGVQYLMESNPAASKIQDAIEQLKGQFSSAVPLVGNYVSRQLLVESKVGDLYVYQHYLVAYERQPISVRISYYKPGNTWLCYSLQFDAKLPDEIREGTDAKLPLDIK